MKLELDQNQIEIAINEKINSAVVEALSGYAIKQAIATTVTESVANGSVAEAIKQAVAKVDKTRLVEALAAQIERTTTACVCRLLETSFIDMMMNLQGYQSFQTKERAEFAANMRAELDRSK